MVESGLFSVLYCINFQIRQIIATNQMIFSSIKPRTVTGVKISEKKNINFPRLKSLYLFPGGPNNGVEIRAFECRNTAEVFPDGLFEENFQFKWKQPATKIASEFSFSFKNCRQNAAKASLIYHQWTVNVDIRFQLQIIWSCFQDIF